MPEMLQAQVPSPTLHPLSIHWSKEPGVIPGQYQVWSPNKSKINKQNLNDAPAVNAYFLADNFWSLRMIPYDFLKKLFFSVS